MRISGRIFIVFLMYFASFAVVRAEAINLGSGGVAIQGYDPVAYFTEQAAVKGTPSIAHKHGGAVYHFASEANRSAFKANPGKYEPQFGGYCAYGVARGYKASIQPQQFSVVGGKLYLNHNKSVQSIWKKDIPGYLSEAKTKWPAISAN